MYTTLKMKMSIDSLGRITNFLFAQWIDCLEKREREK